MFDIPIENKSKPALDLGAMMGGQPQPMQPQMQQPMATPQPQYAPQPMQQPQYAPQPMAQPVTAPMQPTPRPQGNGVVLAKGQKVSLSKMNPNLDMIDVGLGWDVNAQGQAYDLDVEAFLLGADGRVIGDDWFVFYNQPISPDGAIKLLGDSRTGAGAGDDETISVKLRQLNPSVAKIVFIVTINEAREKGYNFSNVQNAYVRIVDKATGNELVKFNLTDYYASVSSMMVGELYNHNGDWKFNPIGDGTSDDLMGLCARYGVNVAG